MKEYWFDFVGSVVHCYKMNGSEVDKTEVVTMNYNSENKCYEFNFDDKHFTLETSPTT